MEVWVEFWVVINDLHLRRIILPDLLSPSHAPGVCFAAFLPHLHHHLRLRLLTFHFLSNNKEHYFPWTPDSVPFLHVSLAVESVTKGYWAPEQVFWFLWKILSSWKSSNKSKTKKKRLYSPFKEPLRNLFIEECTWKNFYFDWPKFYIVFQTKLIGLNYWQG